MFSCQPGLNRANRSKDASNLTSLIFIFNKREDFSPLFNLHGHNFIKDFDFLLVNYVISGVSAATALACRTNLMIESSLLDYTLPDMFIVRLNKNTFYNICFSCINLVFGKKTYLYM